MLYFSTNHRSPRVSFRDAVLWGQAGDRGLYYPDFIPRFSDEFLSTFHDRSNAEIAFEVIGPYVGNTIPADILLSICTETVDFPFPVVDISDNISALELFHGPTLAFKDVGARFMSRCLRYFSRDSGSKIVVLVATSGDTGGAVAAGFHNVKGIEVVILYPKGNVSKIQELQLTTLGGNVTAIEVNGSFDDCQALAKKTLADDELRENIHFTSANSINVARWLPQQFYYFFALKNWKGEPPVISVPSGNFGNLAAGVLADLSGLPIKKFIGACNANDVVPEFFKSGEYAPKPSIATLSNAMDVGHPSNFVRILEMLGRTASDLKRRIEAVSISDETTAATMREIYQKYGYVLDPHGAVGYRALADYLQSHPGERGIFLETAHPIKFDSVTDILGTR
ncbi:MAG: threonine synthase, partial [Pyrinomonadaceae bacterium]